MRGWKHEPRVESQRFGGQGTCPGPFDHQSVLPWQAGRLVVWAQASYGDR